ncbi:MAG: DUF262 domain-containing protein [Candidatus Latescibacterota bacterium]
MSLFEDTNPRALKDLLGEIHSRTMALPDFQRDFVWEPGATQELIVSIANNYPAGSLLRVRDAQRVFAAREFEGAPPLDGQLHTFLVLDGQQRLTSLYQAFYGVGEHRYYLRVGKLVEGVDFEEAIFHVRASTKWVQAHEDAGLQAREMVLPLSVLKGGAGGFLQWLLQVTNALALDERTQKLDALTRVNEQWIKTIDDYHFPVVTLSDKTEPDALCTIFETLNRTGVKLSVFELLTARFWPQGTNLRALWDEACVQHPVIDDFAVDPYYVLQGIALASRPTPSCKRSDVLNLTAADIGLWWPKVVAGMAAGLEILRDDCKVMLPRWLPCWPARAAPGRPTPGCTERSSSAGSGAPSSGRPTRARRTARRPRTRPSSRPGWPAKGRRRWSPRSASIRVRCATSPRVSGLSTGVPSA